MRADSTHPPKRRSLIILPTYDERENLREMVDAIRRHVDSDVLIVDDNSPDGTGALADEIVAEHSHVHALHRPGKLGLGTAYILGFRWGLDRGYERLIEMDCDFSHDPADLPRLLLAGEDADLAIGSRYVPGGGTVGWPLRRRLLSRAGNVYASIFLGNSIRDWTGGFRCYTAASLARLDLRRVDANGYSFQIQMAFAVKRAGGRVVEIPITFRERSRGKSKMSGGIALEALRLIPRLRFAPLARTPAADPTPAVSAEKTVLLQRGPDRHETDRHETDQHETDRHEPDRRGADRHDTTGAHTPTLTSTLEATRDARTEPEP